MTVVVVALSLALATASDATAAGVRAYEQLDFRQARTLLEKALTDAALPQRERCRALAYLARALAVLDEPETARLRFQELLALEPDHVVSRKETPRIREAFAAAVAAQPAAVEPHQPPAPASAPPPTPAPAPAPTPEPDQLPPNTASRAAPVDSIAATPVAPPAEADPWVWWWVGGATAVLLVIGAGVAWAATADHGPDVTPTASWALP